MSRIGKLPITVPKNVKVTLNETEIEVNGPEGTLIQKIPKEIKVVFDTSIIKIEKSEIYMNNKSTESNKKYDYLVKPKI